MDADGFTMTVYGTPVAASRARTQPVYRKGAHGRPQPVMVDGRVVTASHTPQKYAEWKRLLKSEAQRVARENGFQIFPAGIALIMSLECVFIRPASVSVKKRPHHTVKPDLDNLAKAVKDALQGVVYENDSQVVRYGAAFLKRYAENGEGPFIRVEIGAVNAGVYKIGGKP